MKIAVIVTTYNRPAALEKVLQGLVQQTRQPDEIIIADDGSSDATRKTIAPFIHNYALNMAHVWQQDKGFRAAEIRNKTILQSSSEYVVFLDGDCIPDKHFVSDHIKLAQQGYFFQGKRVIVSKDSQKKFAFNDICSKYTLFKHALLFHLSNSHHIFRIPFFPAYTVKKLSGVRACNMGVFRKDLFAVNGFNQAFKGWGREDSKIVARLYHLGIKRKEHPFKAVCYHLWHKEASRKGLDENDRLLAEVIESGAYYCHSGMKQQKARNI